MNVELIDTTAADEPVLSNLMQLYLYDFTEFEDWDVGADGRFAAGDLGRWWTDTDRHSYIVRADGQIAGFVMIRRGDDLTPDPDAMDIAEFFVMRRFRRRRVGEAAARVVWDRFPGRWSIRELAGNTGAQAFWRTIIGRYTHGKFADRTYDDERWRGAAQFFDSSG